MRERKNTPKGSKEVSWWRLSMAVAQLPDGERNISKEREKV
jgi:hypothetical protein